MIEINPLNCPQRCMCKKPMDLFLKRHYIFCQSGDLERYSRR